MKSTDLLPREDFTSNFEDTGSGGYTPSASWAGVGGGACAWAGVGVAAWAEARGACRGRGGWLLNCPHCAPDSLPLSVDFLAKNGKIIRLFV